jgi:NAD(P)-dependent dehydrogenase (short-subunit alcohol dehydrogenase family)
MRRMFDSALSAFGGTDVLVNNAGIMQLSTIYDADDAHFDRHMVVNLKGTFNTLREAAKRLREGGRIINFSSSVVGLKLETYGVYAATKAAVEMLTAILAKEMRGRSITVNAIAPGPIATDLFLHGKSAELIERMWKSPRASRHTGRHSCGRFVPRQPRRAVDQRPNDPRERRNDLAKGDGASRLPAKPDSQPSNLRDTRT